MSRVFKTQFAAPCRRDKDLADFDEGWAQSRQAGRAFENYSGVIAFKKTPSGRFESDVAEAYGLLAAHILKQGVGSSRTHQDPWLRSVSKRGPRLCGRPGRYSGNPFSRNITVTN
jgi:hypothetical protein